MNEINEINEIEPFTTFERCKEGESTAYAAKRYAESHPMNIGTITVIKKDRYENERFYEYEVDCGKYRKKTFRGKNVWKHA
jgi:hypothetical protein